MRLAVCVVCGVDEAEGRNRASSISAQVLRVSASHFNMIRFLMPFVVCVCECTFLLSCFCIHFVADERDDDPSSTVVELTANEVWRHVRVNNAWDYALIQLHR